MSDNQGEREFEIGMDEAWKANMKRTYDEYQDLSLSHAKNLNQVALQSMQNAVETANMVAKQAIRHADHEPDQSHFRDLVKALALEIDHDHK